MKIEMSPQQLIILTHMANGYSNREIASIMGIAEGTVKYHIRMVADKMGEGSRIACIMKALKLGILVLTDIMPELNESHPDRPKGDTADEPR